MRRGGGEKIVVHVGNNRQSETLLKFTKSAHRIRPRLPMRQGFWERFSFLVRWGESYLFSELTYDGLQRFAIAAIFPLLGASFEVAIKLEDRRISNVLAMRRQNAVHAAENSVFPIDERTVTIEGENSESAEVEHRGSISGAKS